MKHFLFLSLLFSPFLSQAQAPAKEWGIWKQLIGTWIGEGDGKPGRGSGTFTFQYDLERNIIARRSHSEYPATNDRPMAIHDDVMFVYFDVTGHPDKAIYFDNEGHVIQYSVVFPDDKSVVLTSDANANMPRFRLTYRFEDVSTMMVSFEMAPPGKPDGFSPYISGRVTKQ